jgi:hypothetical protein
VLVLFGEMHHMGPWPRAHEPMNPHNIMKDPPRGWVVHRWTLVVGTRRGMVREGRTDAVLPRGIDESTDRHHHQQRHDPLRELELEGRGQTLRVFEEPHAPFRLRLACIACAPCRR